MSQTHSNVTLNLSSTVRMKAPLVSSLFDTFYSINSDLKSVVYSAGIAFGGEKEWNYLWNVYQTTNDTAEKDLCLSALANTRIPWLLGRYALQEILFN